VASAIAAAWTFDAVYAEYSAFAWRSLLRLGVPPDSVEDAVQDVFVVVHRRLGDFEGRSSLRTWLFGIALRVARTYRRRSTRTTHEPLNEDRVAAHAQPNDRLEQAEQAAIVHALLDALDEDKRVVFILAELEQLSAPEIAETLAIKLNTVYSRLRLARAEFEAAASRWRRRHSP
jgi:RNA polymerase sigma-70 factor (ECF subfamily)